MNKGTGGGEIIRVVHDRHNPYMVSRRELPTDTRLTWAARGLLWYLLSKPDHWQVMFGDLLRAGEARRDKLQGLLKELEGAGYLVRTRTHDARGHWRWASTLYENPADAAEPLPDLPVPAEPSPVAPLPEQAAIQRVGNGANTESSNSRTRGAASNLEVDAAKGHIRNWRTRHGFRFSVAAEDYLVMALLNGWTMVDIEAATPGARSAEEVVDRIGLVRATKERA
jgi:hypothetical protein